LPRIAPQNERGREKKGEGGGLKRLSFGDPHFFAGMVVFSGGEEEGKGEKRREKKKERGRGY